MQTLRLQDVSRTADGTQDIRQALPGPSSPDWQDPETVQRIAHPSIHPVPQPGCKLCPRTPCPCGTQKCPDVFDHRRIYAGCETTIRELAA